jgi:hypothetical protein
MSEIEELKAEIERLRAANGALLDVIRALVNPAPAASQQPYAVPYPYLVPYTPAPPSVWPWRVTWGTGTSTWMDSGGYQVYNATL